ncbi:MAG: NADPH-dependent FMN reductase [Granulosicoccus sp.]
MQILTLSGSTRLASSNSHLLRVLGEVAPGETDFVECQLISKLPIFNPDSENEKTPIVVEEFCKCIDEASGIVISSPEYVHAIPGGLKNAIDWLVSRHEIIRKPIVLAHASHRGDECLAQLRRVLSTVSEGFSEEIFVRIPLVSKSTHEIEEILSFSENVDLMQRFISSFLEHIKSTERQQNNVFSS